MNGDQPVTWLMFFTLAAAIVVAAGGFLYFLRSQRNRDIAADALTGERPGSRSAATGSTPSGAMPELVGVTVVALIAMGLLTSGYVNKSSYETSAVTTPVGTTGAGTGMTQDPGAADRPKSYQPANPAPDSRVPPTASDAGKGADSGSTR